MMPHQKCQEYGLRQEKQRTSKQGGYFSSVYGTETDTAILYQAQSPLSEMKSLIWCTEEPGM